MSEKEACDTNTMSSGHIYVLIGISTFLLLLLITLISIKLFRIYYKKLIERIEEDD